MVAIKHRAENQEKLDAILSAAQKRLGLYGYEKTTMSEIAADVQLSKASMYYYFPDKESLLRAVLEKEQSDYFRLIGERMKKLEDPERMIFEFIRIRHRYFTTFLNLTKSRFSDFFQIRPHLKELIENLRSTEAKLFTEVLKDGMKKGVFRLRHPEKTAVLFLEIIHGLRLVVMRNRPIQELSDEDYDLMFDKHKGFIELFINGIKTNSEKK